MSLLRSPSVAYVQTTKGGKNQARRKNERERISNRLSVPTPEMESYQKRVIDPKKKRALALKRARAARAQYNEQMDLTTLGLSLAQAPAQASAQEQARNHPSDKSSKFVQNQYYCVKDESGETRDWYKVFSKFPDRNYYNVWTITLKRLKTNKDGTQGFSHELQRRVELTENGGEYVYMYSIVPSGVPVYLFAQNRDYSRPHRKTSKKYYL